VQEAKKFQLKFFQDKVTQKANEADAPLKITWG
jgi:hypothetical protein